MEQRELGRTGHRSTVVTFGTAGLGRVEQDVADKAIEAVLEHGVNHIDIAPSYGEAMERLAPWMPQIRDSVFLGTKTTGRTKDAAWDEVRSIQQRLGVDSFDLFQLHAVISMELLDEVTAPGGALEALVEMREQGVTKWLGITGHGPAVPAVHLEALRRFDFDTIMFPVSAAIFRNPDYRRDAEALLAEAASRNVGVQIIKSIARGGWGDHEREHTTWYDPHRDQDDIDRALWWALSQSVHTAPSAGDVNLLPRVLDAAERFVSLSVEEQEEIVQSQSPPLPEPNLGIPAATV
jgi:aryl-alcohol dehydrogenase-like predicted oxidoreductase